jgi:cytochrome b6-f complex iron-sulfur subunit
MKKWSDLLPVSHRLDNDALGDSGVSVGSLPKPSIFQRRNFLKIGLVTLFLTALAEVIGLVTRFLSPKSLHEKTGGVVSVGSIDRYEPGSVTLFREGGFFLIRTEEGGFMAVYRRCPHLGCTVNWDGNITEFYCPCHASSFDLYGEELSPPVPRSLDLLEVSFDEKNILVDTSHVTQRDAFEPGQLVFPTGLLQGQSGKGES